VGSPANSHLFPIFTRRGRSRYRSDAGYIDHEGVIRIEPRFDDAFSFGEGLAAVQVGQSWGYINEGGDQLIEPKLGSGSWFSCGRAHFWNNNGNVQSQAITRSGQTWNQSYLYDQVNRLTSASETGPGTSWSESMGYDLGGNRWENSRSGLVAATSETPSGPGWFGSGTSSYSSNNQVTAGWQYDLAGNLTGIPGMSRSFTYDAENRQATSAVNGVTTDYIYDGEGRRVEKVVSPGTGAAQLITYYMYDATGALAAEFAPGGTAPLQYLTADALGTTRLVTDATGAVAECHDYLPFGEEIGNGVDGRGACFSGDTEPEKKFTAKERDDESGLDYFGARYFSSDQGRFTSPDPIMHPADSEVGELVFVSDPQRWNKYSYTNNNPLRYVDPDGRELIVAQELQKTVATMRQESTSFNGELAAHEGNGPNLTIRLGPTPNDAGGGPTIGNSILPDIEPMLAPFQDWSSGTQYGNYRGATVTISNTIKGDSSQVEGTLAHEVGHVHDARTNTDIYGKQSAYTKETHGAKLHDSRPEEQTANKFKASVADERKQFTDQQKALKKKEKKDEQ